MHSVNMGNINPAAKIVVEMHSVNMGNINHTAKTVVEVQSVSMEDRNLNVKNVVEVQSVSMGNINHTAKSVEEGNSAKQKDVKPVQPKNTMDIVYVAVFIFVQILKFHETIRRKKPTLLDKSEVLSPNLIGFGINEFKMDVRRVDPICFCISGLML
jgi:hypothetical protein